MAGDNNDVSAKKNYRLYYRLLSVLCSGGFVSAFLAVLAHGQVATYDDPFLMLAHSYGAFDRW